MKRRSPALLGAGLQSFEQEPAVNRKIHPIAAPHIDRCGFENYRSECVQCDTALAGIVDPSDNKLLLSQVS
jgi:hypothetical protein